MKGVKYILLDLTKKKYIEKKLKDDYSAVINLSGHTTNLYSQNLKKKIFQSHYIGAKNLIDFFKKKKIQIFIQIGSSAEYGKAKSPLQETVNCKPNNIYGRAKLKATKYVLSVAEKNKFPATVLRFFQVYGPKQGENRAVMQILKFCINKKKFPASDGKQIRDFCFIKDAINAIELTINKKVYRKVINIGYGKGISMRRLINIIKGIAKGGKPQFGVMKSRNHENPVLVPSIIRARKILGWKPKVKLKKGLKITQKKFND